MRDLPAGVSIETVWLVEVPYTAEAATRRPALRPQHVGRIAQLIREGVVIEAGGTTDFSKAVLLLRAESAEAAIAIVEADVYTTGGVWHSPTAVGYGRVVADDVGRR